MNVTLISKVVGRYSEYERKVLESFDLQVVPIVDTPYEYLPHVDAVIVNALDPISTDDDHALREIQAAVGEVPVIFMVKGRDSLTSPRLIGVVPKFDSDLIQVSGSTKLAYKLDFMCVVDRKTPLFIYTTTLKNRSADFRPNTLAEILKYFKVFLF